jgi:hypothetical protein
MPVEYKIHVNIHLLLLVMSMLYIWILYIYIYEIRFGHATNHLKFCEIFLNTEIYFRIPG